MDLIHMKKGFTPGSINHAKGEKTMEAEEALFSRGNALSSTLFLIYIL